MRKKKANDKHKCLTKADICEALVMAPVWAYNRQITNDEYVKKLPYDKWFPITMQIDHNHREGEPCEPHKRIWVATADGYMMFDVPLEFYDRIVVR